MQCRKSVMDSIIQPMSPVQSHSASAASRGFTLPELMIVVTIIGVLALIAYPMFVDQARKSRRADAIAALSQLAQAQERWRAVNPAYTVDLSASGVNVANPSSGFYTLSVPAAASAAYTLTATTAGAQAADARCTSLSMSMNGGNLSYLSAGTASPAQCWNR